MTRTASSVVAAVGEWESSRVGESPLSHSPTLQVSKRPMWLTGLIALAVAGSSVIVAAQDVDTLVTPPGNIMLSNYNSVPLGPNAGLEGSAYVARVGDPSAAWLN